jgi:acyl-coenzyme A thioesterase PaaI-like protein
LVGFGDSVNKAKSSRDDFMKNAIAQFAQRSTAALGFSVPKNPLELERAFLDPIKRNAFFVAMIPSLAFFGVKISKLNGRECQVDIPFTWRTQNPFQSVYFAAQSAAAELTTGALILRAIAAYPHMSMLVVSMKAEFGKKAKSDVSFVCLDGEAIHEAAERALGGESVTVSASAVGRMANGDEVSRFTFEWALKVKP